MGPDKDGVLVFEPDDNDYIFTDEDVEAMLFFLSPESDELWETVAGQQEDIRLGLDAGYR